MPVVVDAVQNAGLQVERVLENAGFIRLLITSEDDRTELDLGSDARIFPVDRGPGFPLLSGEELAVDKVLAIFGRVEPRDFVDLAAVVDRYGLDRLFELAADKDRGFNPGVFALGQPLRPDSERGVSSRQQRVRRATAGGRRVASKRRRAGTITSVPTSRPASWPRSRTRTVRQRFQPVGRNCKCEPRPISRTSISVEPTWMVALAAGPHLRVLRRRPDRQVRQGRRDYANREKGRRRERSR